MGAYHEIVTVQTRVVLATLCVFNGIILTIIGVGAVVFVDGSVRLGVAGSMWLIAVGLFILARRLRKEVEWR